MSGWTFRPPPQPQQQQNRAAAETFVFTTIGKAATVVAALIVAATAQLPQNPPQQLRPTAAVQTFQFTPVPAGVPSSVKNYGATAPTVSPLANGQSQQPPQLRAALITFNFDPVPVGVPASIKNYGATSPAPSPLANSQSQFPSQLKAALINFQFDPVPAGVSPSVRNYGASAPAVSPAANLQSQFPGQLKAALIGFQFDPVPTSLNQSGAYRTTDFLPVPPQLKQTTAALLGVTVTPDSPLGYIQNNAGAYYSVPFLAVPPQLGQLRAALIGFQFDPVPFEPNIQGAYQTLPQVQPYQPRGIAALFGQPAPDNPLGYIQNNAGAYPQAAFLPNQLNRTGWLPATFVFDPVPFRQNNAAAYPRDSWTPPYRLPGLAALLVPIGPTGYLPNYRGAYAPAAFLAVPYQLPRRAWLPASFQFDPVPPIPKPTGAKILPWSMAPETLSAIQRYYRVYAVFAPPPPATAGIYVTSTVASASGAGVAYPAGGSGLAGNASGTGKVVG